MSAALLLTVSAVNVRAFSAITSAIDLPPVGLPSISFVFSRTYFSKSAFVGLVRNNAAARPNASRRMSSDFIDGPPFPTGLYGTRQARRDVQTAGRGNSRVRARSWPRANSGCLRVHQLPLHDQFDDH